MPLISRIGAEQAWKIPVVVVKPPLISWLRCSQVTRAIENFYCQGPEIQNAFYFCHYSQQDLSSKHSPCVFKIDPRMVLIPRMILEILSKSFAPKAPSLAPLKLLPLSE